MPDYPFLRPEFLAVLESSQSVGHRSGWQPLHLGIGDSTYSAFMPLYRKTHSWGEYVFDWAWANVYRSHGMDYYPKLVSAIPFTPATGPRIRFSGVVDQAQAAAQLVEAGINLCREQGASGWHILFPDQVHLELLQDDRLIRRTGVQYHWFNQGYGHFDDFLDQLASRKRKMIRKERRQASDQGLTTELLPGAEITPSLWQFFYQVYRRTYLKRSGNNGYLTADFFHRIGEVMPEQIAMAVARHSDKPVAAALYFYDAETLYGRYWGCLQEFDTLHFELCYYQGIELAIRLGLQKFDAGAQGEHKILRGFRPVFTHSLHWIADRDFDCAIRNFVHRERLELEHYQKKAAELLPYKQQC